MGRIYKIMLSKEENMNYKLSLRVFSVVYMLLGLSLFVLSPSFILQLFGVGLIPTDMTLKDTMDFWRVIGFLRVFGAAILFAGILFNFLAFIEGEKNCRLVTSGIAVGSFLFFLMAITQQIAFWETIAGWMFLTVFIITFINFTALSVNNVITSKHLTLY